MHKAVSVIEQTGYINGQGYRRVHAKGHVLANNDQKSPRVAQHRLVLFDAIGYGPHTCYWCDDFIQWNGPTGWYLDVDHVNHNRLDNRLENLVQSCHWCNTCRISDVKGHMRYEPKRKGKRVVLTSTNQELELAA